MEMAEALFLQRLDSAIVELAKRIGRGSEDAGCISGKFQTASRSDISGITVGNDENQLFDFIFKKMPDNPQKIFLNTMCGKGESGWLFTAIQNAKNLSDFSVIKSRAEEFKRNLRVNFEVDEVKSFFKNK